MQCCANKEANKSDNTNPMVMDNINSSKISYFISELHQEVDRKVSGKLTRQLQTDFEGLFSRIGCFDDTFSLQVKPGSKLCQALL